MKDKKLRIIPLGGLGEVGKNMMVYEYDQQILIVDAGLMFPENDMLGIDYIIPDIQYLADKREWVKGIVITHGHEDHTGAIHHLLEQVNAPIYATPLTRGLLEVKLSRGGLDGVGLGITTPAGLIVHSGDYKFDHTPVDNWPTDYAKLAEFSGRGVLALLADSTNSYRPGWTPSERVIEPAFDEVFRNAPGRVIVASFASLISRMQQVGNTALKHGRKLAFVGMSMVENAKMARKLGYLNLPDDLLVPVDQALKLPLNEVVLMCTGTQGEPTSIMGRLSMGTNRQFDLLPGDTVVLSSHAIPGNEESVYRTINRLFRRGANVIYDAIAPVHVSGHASQEEMKLMLNLVKPKFFIPMHGELHQLHQHASIARKLGFPSERIAVVENGQVIEFESGEMDLGERIPGGYIFVDGAMVGDIGPTVVRERETLAREGVVLVNLTVDRNTRLLCEEPEIISRGFIYPRSTEEWAGAMSRLVKEIVQNGNGSLEDDLEQVVKSFIYNKTKRRPIVFVTISQK
ncbi:MAG: ribonuclease J [Anaerolineales bacterium]|nr:ribonuclease J [Anaerolineales bacterium]